MKKIVALLLVLVMMLSMVACGGSNTETTPVKDEAEATQGAQAQVTNPVKEDSNADPNAWIINEDTSISGTVRWWMPFKDTQGMGDLIAAFNEVYPNIKVELTTYSNNTDGNLQVNTAIMAGQVDVLGSFGLANTFTRWNNNLYMDITDRVEAEGIDLVENWGTDAYTFDGKVYSLPCGGISYYVAINMTAWEEAGLGEIPTEWTWDEYLAACEAMTKVGADGAVEIYGGCDYRPKNMFTYPVYQVNGKDQYYNADGTSSLDSDLVINSLAREIKAENEDKIWFPKTTIWADNLQTQDVYTQKKSASAITCNINRFLADSTNYPVDFVTAFAPYPTEEAGQTNYCAGVANYSHAGICTGAADVDAAWAFLKWYSTYGSVYLVRAGHQSAWRGTDSSKIVDVAFGSAEEAAKVVDVESFTAVVGNTALPYYVDTFMTAYAEVDAIAIEYVMYALSGEMTAEEAMKEAAKLANDAIEAAK